MVIYDHNKTLASLTMDFDSMRLYFVYDNSGISYFDVASKVIHVVLTASNVMTISAVTVYNGTLYFPENIQGVIMSCDKDTCFEYSILRKNTKKIQYLKMFYAEAQQGANTCAGPLKGGCSHLCFATSNQDHSCGCAIGYRVDPSNPTQCVGVDEFLFYTNHELKGVEIYDPNKPVDEEGQKMVSMDTQLSGISYLKRILCTGFGSHFSNILGLIYRLPCCSRLPILGRQRPRHHFSHKT